MNQQASDKGDSSVTGKAHHVNHNEIARGRWISLNEVTYKDPTGKERKWEAVFRTTNQQGGADAVVVVAILKRKGQPDNFILVKQYRPPLKAYSIEFPAGLIDKGESPYESAVREMKEETGYVGVPKDCSPCVSLDPGVGSSCVNTVTVEIDGDLPENINPKHEQEDGEFIDTYEVPKDKLMETLSNFSSEGCIVHSMVYAYAVALSANGKA